MIQVITTEYIEASPEAVWDFISNLQRIPEWVVGTKQMLSVSTADAGAGTEYRELTQIGPSTAETTWQITTFRAPSVQIHETRSALLHAILTMTVEPEGSGARLTHSIEGQMLPKVPVLGGLLGKIMQRQVINDMRQTVREARRIIEREFGVTEQAQRRAQNSGYAHASH